MPGLVPADEVLSCGDKKVPKEWNGFIKKQQKTPAPELDLARDRLKLLKRR